MPQQQGDAPPGRRRRNAPLIGYMALLVIQLSAVTVIMFAIGGWINAKWSDLTSEASIALAPLERTEISSASLFISAMRKVTVDRASTSEASIALVPPLEPTESAETE